MFIDSYNQWKGTTVLDYEFVTSGTALYNSSVAGTNGYAVAPAYGQSSISQFLSYTANDSAEAGPTGRTMYVYAGSGTFYHLASPSCRDEYSVCRVNGGNGQIASASSTNNFSGTMGVCPVVSLEN